MLDRFLFSFVEFLEYSWVFGPFTIKNMCLVFKKSACLFGQVKTKIYLPESPFFLNSLAGASGLVLMLLPVKSLQQRLMNSPFAFTNYI